MKKNERLAEAERRIAECQTTGRTGLDLDVLELTALPESVRALRQLERLNIRNNHITALPPWIVELRNLRRLGWWDNGPVVLPEALAELPRLESLDIGRNNAITGLDVVEKLLALRTLDLDRMELTAVPECLRGASLLEHLSVSNSRLTYLPDWAGGWTALRHLDLNGNPLTTLPDTLAALTELRVLALASTELMVLPAVLHLLPKLEKLNLHGNPKLNLPDSILGAYDAQKILAYDRRMRTAAEQRPLNEAKMIIVGRGAVGKTTLVHQFVHGKFVLKHKTKGIKVSDWQVSDGKESIPTHVWDFGGQEIMHGTHQFFLTERALYILVLAGREDKEDEDAHYWLKMIRAFGGDAPVMVVLNKIKEHRFEVDEEQLKKDYPNIVGFHETDCKKNVGIVKLRKAVEAHIRGMEDVKKVFPAAWYRIKQELPTRAVNFISFDEFRKVCGELGEKEPKEQEHLAHFLHVLGIALNYRDDPRLQETSVLNPHWVTGGIYALINDDRIMARRGVLSKGDLKRVLKAVEYPEDKHDFLLLLMKKFELCFPLDDEMKEWLVPELLTKKGPKPGEEFDPKAALCFEYHYETLLPHGLLPRFISRAYTRIVGDLRWRTGVVVGWAGTKALVRADADKRRVEIRVSGEDRARREALDWVRGHFDEIHQNFKKLDPREVVRVPGRPELAVSVARLARAARRNQTHIEIEVEGDAVEVDVRYIVPAFFGEGFFIGVEANSKGQTFRLRGGGRG